MTLQDPKFQTMLAQLQTLPEDAAPEPLQTEDDVDFKDFGQAVDTAVDETVITVSPALMKRHLQHMRLMEQDAKTEERAALRQRYLSLSTMQPPQLDLRCAFGAFVRLLDEQSSHDTQRADHLFNHLEKLSTLVWYDHDLGPWQKTFEGQLYKPASSINLCPDVASARAAAEEIIAKVKNRKKSYMESAAQNEHPMLVFSKQLTESLKQIRFPVEDALHQQHCADIKAEMHETGDATLKALLEPHTIEGRPSLNFNEALAAFNTLTLPNENHPDEVSRRYEQLQVAYMQLIHAIWTNDDTMTLANNFRRQLYNGSEQVNMTYGPVWANQVTREILRIGQTTRNKVLGIGQGKESP